MIGSFGLRALLRIGAFMGACAITAGLLAVQAGLPGGVVPAALYLAAQFAPFALIDALLVPAPRSGAGRLARIGFAFLLLGLLGTAWNRHALDAVPFDLQLQIAFEIMIRNFALLGVYLLLERLFASMIARRMPA